VNKSADAAFSNYGTLHSFKQEEATSRACPIPKSISALPQRLENGRHSTRSALAPRWVRVLI
jgi:hypothetical protein